MIAKLGTNYFGNWPFYKRALAIALPVMAQGLIQNLVSLVDNFMVSGLGDIKMSGVNVANQIFFNFFIVLNTICISAGIFMSQFKGANHKEGMKQTFKFKLLLMGFFAVGFSILCFIAPSGLFELMVKNNNDASAIVEQSIMYSKSIAFSWIISIVSQAIASSLREIEIVRPPLVISVIATLINTGLNWILIYGNLGAPRLEVAGAGYATMIARICELIMFLVYAAKKRPDFIFNPLKLFHIDYKLFASIIKKSGMILYSEVFWAISETLSNALYNGRGGAEVCSGMACGFAIANLIFISMGGVMTSASVILGQELGAGNLEQSRKYKNWLLSGAAIFGLFFLVFGIAASLLVGVIFKELSPESQNIARGLVIIMSVYLPLWTFLNGQYAVSRTGGDTTMGVICDTVGNVLFIGGMLTLTFCTDLGPVWMFAIVKLSDVPKSIIAHFWLKKEKWLVNLTVEHKDKE